MTPPRSYVEARQDAGLTVARITGCDGLNEFNSESVGQELYRLAGGPGCARLLLDLGAVRYLTSAALGKLVGLNRRVRSAGGRLALCNVGPVVREALAVTCLDRLLEIVAGDGPAGRPAA
jgi:anti-sigma B factor antagonist